MSFPDDRKAANSGDPIDPCRWQPINRISYRASSPLSFRRRFVEEHAPDNLCVFRARQRVAASPPRGYFSLFVGLARRRSGSRSRRPRRSRHRERQRRAHVRQKDKIDPAAVLQRRARYACVTEGRTSPSAEPCARKTGIRGVRRPAERRASRNQRNGQRARREPHGSARASRLHLLLNRAGSLDGPVPHPPAYHHPARRARNGH